MKKQQKRFERPKKPFDSKRIKEENKLKTKYGLKNKKEIWKSGAKVKYYRTRAKSLITAERETQQKFFDKLNEIGLGVESVADVLALTVEDILKRRLSTVVAGKGLADTAKQARQMITHKRILVKGKVVNVPSYLVKVEEEDKINLKKKVKKPKLIAEMKEESADKQEEKNE